MRHRYPNLQLPSSLSSRCRVRDATIVTESAASIHERSGLDEERTGGYANREHNPEVRGEFVSTGMGTLDRVEPDLYSWLLAPRRFKRASAATARPRFRVPDPGPPSSGVYMA